MSVAEKNNVSRISVSLPAHLLWQLDDMVSQCGFESRSQAIVTMINQRLAEYKTQLGDQIMAGVITLVYDHSRPGLQQRLTDLQHRYLDEVISSLHVQLMWPNTLEVILVQGPAARLRQITDELVTCPGVSTGTLQLSTAILPPVHPLASRLVQELEIQT